MFGNGYFTNYFFTGRTNKIIFFCVFYIKFIINKSMNKIIREMVVTSGWTGFKIVLPPRHQSKLTTTAGHAHCASRTGSGSAPTSGVFTGGGGVLWHIPVWAPKVPWSVGCNFVYNGVIFSRRRPNSHGPGTWVRRPPLGRRDPRQKKGHWCSLNGCLTQFKQNMTINISKSCKSVFAYVKKRSSPSHIRWSIPWRPPQKSWIRACGLRYRVGRVGHVPPHIFRYFLTRDAEPEPEPKPEPPEPTHFGRSRRRSRSRRNGLLGAGAGAGAVKNGSGSEKGYNCGKITEC